MNKPDAFNKIIETLLNATLSILLIVLPYSSFASNGKEVIYSQDKLRIGNSLYSLSQAPTQFKNILNKSTELVLVNHLKNPNYFILLSRQQSKPQPLGHCGTGSEDYLLLIDIAKGVAKLRDKLLLQSCEQNIYLDVEDPYSAQDIISGLTFDADKTKLKYLMRKFDGNNFVSIKRTVCISNNKFTIEQ